MRVIAYSEVSVQVCERTMHTPHEPETKLPLLLTVKRTVPQPGSMYFITYVMYQISLKLYVSRMEKLVNLSFPQSKPHIYPLRDQPAIQSRKIQALKIPPRESMKNPFLDHFIDHDNQIYPNQ